MWKAIFVCLSFMIDVFHVILLDVSSQVAGKNFAVFVVVVAFQEKIHRDSSQGLLFVVL